MGWCGGVEFRALLVLEGRIRRMASPSGKQPAGFVGMAWVLCAGGGVLTTPDDECMPVLWKDLDRDLPCVGFVLSLRKVTPLGWALSWSHLLLALYFRAPGCSFPVCHGRDGDGSRGRVGKEGLVDGRSERGWASAVYSWEWW